jgi:hypothetical protein
MLCQFSNEFRNEIGARTPQKWKSGVWSGWYEQGGTKFDQSMNIHFLDQAFEGTGQDPVGVFLISGGVGADDESVHWLKHYLGRHTVIYRGRWQGKGIAGRWIIPNGRALIDGSVLLSAAAQGEFFVFPV